MKDNTFRIISIFIEQKGSIVALGERVTTIAIAQENTNTKWYSYNQI
jgi:hypothetical protein